jgi:hypothetical protein
VVGVAAIAVVLEGVVDELVEQFPACPRLDGHHGGAQRDGPGDRVGRRLLDEDRRGRLTGVGELLLDPAHRIGVGHPEQEVQVGRSRADGQPQPHVVSVHQRHRADRHVEPTRRLDQRHQRAVQRQQQLPEPETGLLFSHR